MGRLFRVMIVDDDYIVRQGMLDMLRWEDMRCEVAALAEDGADALERMASAPVDIVFTDVVMPRMDGLELLRRINKLHSGVKVVIISAYDESASIRAALRYEAVDYLLKPFDERDVFEALTRVKLRMARESQAEFAGEDERAVYVANALSEGDPALAVERATRLICDKGISFLRAATLCVDILLCACARVPGCEGEFMADAMLADIFRATNAGELSALMREGIYKLSERVTPYGLNARIARAAVGMLKEQFQDNPTVLQMASALNISENHLQAIFKREVGMTIRQFLTEVRVQHAAKLLAETDKKIFAVAMDVGYRDVDHFSRVFKEKMGVTPNAYRERLNA